MATAAFWTREGVSVVSAADDTAESWSNSACVDRERDSIDAAKPASSASFSESMAESDPPRTDQESGVEGRDSSMSESGRALVGRSPVVESTSEASVRL